MTRPDKRAARFGDRYWQGAWTRPGTPTVEWTPTAQQADNMRDLALVMGGTLWDLLPYMNPGPGPGFVWSLPNRWPTANPQGRPDYPSVRIRRR